MHEIDALDSGLYRMTLNRPEMTWYWIEKRSLKPLPSDPDAWLCQIKIKLLFLYLCVFFKTCLAERSREGVFPLRLIWIQSAAGSLQISGRHRGDYGRSSLPASVSLAAAACDPGKRGAGHR